MDSIYAVIAFWLLSLVTIVSALLVVLRRNLVHSVLWLIVTFIGVAGIFLLLNADYLAVVQILVYAGAVCIMVVFGVMLTHRGDIKKSNPVNGLFKIAAPVAALLLIVIGALAAKAGNAWSVSNSQVPADTVQNIATLLFSKYMVPFEVAALLLLVALIGAVVLAKEVKASAND